MVKLKNSKKYKLNKQDLKKILTGAGVAIGSAAITFTADIITQIDFGSYTVLVMAVSGILINAARKLLAGK